ncbi:cyclase family protein [Clostridium felsineum]|uniref:cyclase family protein n=1 Tax=Clostridium felsineum TaxID=36839 RepID=UPI00098BFF88|nr:cyclase family protein [Clostridium felsineum]URZ03772.1 Kynurenine formamidase [Clostridium felsineum]
MSKFKTIDLSIGFYTNMPKYNADWYPEFKYEEILPSKLVQANWKRRFTYINLFAHNATHVETSDHVFKDGNTLKNYNIDTFVGHPIILDLTQVEYGTAITYEDILNSIKERSIPENSIILIKTLYNDNNWGKDDFWDKSPWLDYKAAEFIEKLKPSLVGIDFQTEKPKEKDFVVHKTILNNNTVLCEYLKNLDKIDEKVLFLAVPIKLSELEASPVRAMGIKFLEE